MTKISALFFQNYLLDLKKMCHEHASKLISSVIDSYVSLQYEYSNVHNPRTMKIVKWLFFRKEVDEYFSD